MEGRQFLQYGLFPQVHLTKQTTSNRTISVCGQYISHWAFLYRPYRQFPSADSLPQDISWCGSFPTGHFSIRMISHRTISNFPPVDSLPHDIFLVWTISHRTFLGVDHFAQDISLYGQFPTGRFQYMGNFPVDISRITNFPTVKFLGQFLHIWTIF